MRTLSSTFSEACNTEDGYVDAVMVLGQTEKNREYKGSRVITRGLRFVSQGAGKGWRGGRGQRWRKTNENELCERRPERNGEESRQDVRPDWRKKYMCGQQGIKK